MLMLTIITLMLITLPIIIITLIVIQYKFCIIIVHLPFGKQVSKARRSMSSPTVSMQPSTEGSKCVPALKKKELTGCKMFNIRPGYIS